jgi:hypothetical protein
MPVSRNKKSKSRTNLVKSGTINDKTFLPKYPDFASDKQQPPKYPTKSPYPSGSG